MAFSREREADPTNPGKTRRVTRPSLTLGNTVIKPVSTHKYLGVLMDDELRWKEQAEYATAKATKWVMMLRRIGRPSTGLNTKLLRQLYLSVAVPKMTYAIDVWWTPVRPPPPGKKQHLGSVGFTKRLEGVQRMATLAITGALRTTATDVLDIHADTLPIELLLHQACQRSIVRLASLPDTHPLQAMVRRCAKMQVKKHRTPIHEMLRTYEIDPTNIETLSPIRRLPTQQNTFVTHIARSRDESKDDNQQNKDNIRVYADGSGYKGQAGAAAVLYRSLRRPKVLRYHLGPLTQHTTAEAETVGILLAAELIRRESFVTTATIALDNQAVIRSTDLIRRQPGQRIMDNFVRLTNIIAQQNRRPNYRLRVVWISGHDEVEGNELADSEAKKAAEGDSSPASDLPWHLRANVLPHNVSAVKQDLTKTLQRIWRKRWTNSPRYAKISKIDDKLPSKQYRQLAATLPRAHSSLIMQLRSHTIPLNQYLHMIKRNDTARCPNCDLADENIRHFLFECPAYARERHALREQLGRRAKNMKYLLGDLKGMKATIKYVAQTRRFKWITGDVPNRNHT